MNYNCDKLSFILILLRIHVVTSWCPPSRIISGFCGTRSSIGSVSRARRVVPRLRSTALLGHDRKITKLRNIVEDGLDLEMDGFENIFTKKKMKTKKVFNTNEQTVQSELRSHQTTESTISSTEYTDTPPMTVRNGIAIIAGTAIGGGFLALPSVTAPIGYGPTALGLLLIWLYLTLSGHAFIEAAGLTSDARSRREFNGLKESYNETAEAGGGLAISSIITEAFGKRWGFVSGIAFVFQMFAVMTIQVVKGASIISQLTQIPYSVACLFPPVLAASFVYFSRSEVVESGNTVLTAMMVLGFALLCLSALTSNTLGVSSVAFSRNKWISLLPSTKATWAIPVLMKLLAWGEAMPLLTERMVEAASKSDYSKVETIQLRGKAQRQACKTTTLGSTIPLMLCLIWAAISTLLIDPTTTSDPISFLLSLKPSISIPVGLLSFGAIGTTLLGSLLAMGHFASDIINSVLGKSDPIWTTISRIITLIVPCLCAYLGPGLYLPLLAFAGAYPTTLLYGLAPSLAAIILRNRAEKENVDHSRLTPSLLPGGIKILTMLVMTSVGIVASCSTFAIRAAFK